MSRRGFSVLVFGVGFVIGVAIGYIAGIALDHVMQWITG